MMPLKKPVTLKNLAEILELTPATISRALHDSPEISEKTKILVKKKAAELGYQPNLMARSLSKRRSNILGVIVPDFRISFFAEASRGIYQQGRALNYETIIVVSNGKGATERRKLDFLSALNVDGIIIDPVHDVKNIAIMKRIDDRGIPIVFFDRGIDGMDLPAVTSDDENAAFKVINRFVEHGRRDIIFIGPKVNLFIAKGRYEGYCKALAHHGIEYRAEYVVTCGLDREDVKDKIQQLISSGQKFNAVMCAGGLVAYNAGKAILKAGLSIPNDVMLSEFGDNNIVHRLGVPFLTIDQFPYVMGQKAAEMMIDIIELRKTERPKQFVFVDNELIYHHEKKESRK